MQSIFANELYGIEHDADRQLVIIRRSAMARSSANWDLVLAALDVLRPLRGQRLLIDVRRAPGNNDPTLEQAIHKFRRQLSELFPITASLAATAVGRLQLVRMSRERSESGSRVFLDESEAIAYLMAQPVGAAASRPRSD